MAGESSEVLAGERETITALFADIKGPMELIEGQLKQLGDPNGIRTRALWRSGPLGQSVALRVQVLDTMRTPPSPRLQSPRLRSPRLRFDLPDSLWQDRREVGRGLSAL